MKKYFKILIILFLFIFGINTVKADIKELEISNIEIINKSATTVADKIVLDNNKITSNITFNNVDDYIKIKLGLKNNDDRKYKIISIEDNNKNNNISISYNYEKEYIEKNKTAVITIKMIYENELVNQEKISLNDLNIKINLEREDGVKQVVIANPTTQDSILHYLVLIILALVGMILVLIKKKNKTGTLLLIIASILIPLSAIAVDRYEMNLKFTNIDIIGKIITPEPEPVVLEYATLIEGSSINSKITSESKTFRKATLEEYNLVKDTLTNDNIISIEDSPKEVYMWESGTVTLYYSDANIIYMNEDSKGMFKQTGFTSIDLSDLNSSKVIDMSSMFEDCEYLEDVNLSSLDTSNVIDMSYMFDDCENIETIDISSFNTSKVTNMEYMFNACDNLKTIYILDEWDTSKVTSFDSMFEEDYYLVGEKATYYDGEMNYAALDDYSDINYAHVDGGIDNPGYLTLKNHVKDFSILLHGYYGFDDKNYEIAEDATSFRKATKEEYNLIKDFLTEDNIVSEEYSPIPIYMWKDEDTVLYYSTASTIYLHYSADSMFSCSSYETIDLSGLDSGRVIWMDWMFRDAYNLKEIIFGDNFDTSNVKGMDGMFYSCANLEQLDLSSFDTSNVKYMLDMFCENEMLDTIYVSDKWDISNVEDSNNMFQSAYQLFGEKGTAYDNNKTNKEYAHVDEGEANPGYLTLKGHTKTQKPATLKEGYSMQWYLENNSSGTNTFRKATLEEYNDAKSSLSEDNIISDYDSPKVYIWASGEETLYYSKSEKIYLNEDSSYMFRGSPFETIDLSGFDSSRVTNMSGMFSDCTSLTNIIFDETTDSINSQNLSASVNKLSKNNSINPILIIIPIVFIIIASLLFVFYKKNTSNKTQITVGTLMLVILLLSLSILLGGTNYKRLLASITSSSSNENTTTSFDTSNVTDMSEMFKNCTSLEEINLSSFDTSNVTNMDGMFMECSSLVELDISYFNINKVESMSSMFYNCSSLETIYVDESWKFETYIEYGCGYYEYVDSPTPFESVYTEGIFSGCVNLVGEKGTTYNSDNSGGYAVIDKGPLGPGYLTLKGHEKDYNIEYGLLLPADDFNSKINSLYDSYGYYYGPDYYGPDSDEEELDYRHFRKATEEEYNSVKDTLTDDDLISVPNSKKVYAWIDANKDTLYYSEANIIYLHRSSENLFANTIYTTIDLSGFDSSKTVYMDNMFVNCQYLTNINFGNFDTSNVITMDNMFYYCEKLVELDLSSFNTSKVQNISSMFYGCNSIKSIYVSDMWNINIPEDNNKYSVFDYCYELVGGAGTTYNYSYRNGNYAHIDGGEDNPGYFTHINDKPQN